MLLLPLVQQLLLLLLVLVLLVLVLVLVLLVVLVAIGATAVATTSIATEKSCCYHRHAAAVAMGAHWSIVCHRCRCWHCSC
jgi:hypothetical protein